MNMKMIKSFSEKAISQKEMKSKDEDKINVMRRSISEKTMLYKKTKKKMNIDDDDKEKKGKMKIRRFLITINVFGSAGPIRFIVNEDEQVSAVIETALKLYGREGRLPILTSHTDAFSLYPATAVYEALNPWEAIGSQGVRDFVLRKKERNKGPHMSEARSQEIHRNGSRWRAWLDAYLLFKNI